MAIRVCVSMCVLPISKFVRLYVRYHGSLVALKKIKMKEKKEKEMPAGILECRINLRLWFNTRFPTESTSFRTPIFVILLRHWLFYPNRAISIPSNEFFDSGQEIYVYPSVYIGVYCLSVCRFVGLSVCI